MHCLDVQPCAAIWLACHQANGTGTFHRYHISRRVSQISSRVSLWSSNVSSSQSSGSSTVLCQSSPGKLQYWLVPSQPRPWPPERLEIWLKLLVSVSHVACEALKWHGMQGSADEAQHTRSGSAKQYRTGRQQELNKAAQVRYR